MCSHEVTENSAANSQSASHDDEKLWNMVAAVGGNLAFTDAALRIAHGHPFVGGLQGYSNVSSMSKCTSCCKPVATKPYVVVVRDLKRFVVWDFGCLQYVLTLIVRNNDPSRPSSNDGLLHNSCTKPSQSISRASYVVELRWALYTA